MASTVNPDLDNKLVYQYAHANPDIYGLHWFVPTSNKIEFSDKIVGIKYHGAYLNNPVTSMSKYILEELDKQKKILLVHCGRYLEGDIKSNTSYLHAIQVARHYPNIKVVLAHMGGTDTTVCKKAISHAEGIHNVYFDTSGITTPSIIEYACNRLPVTRILFGSDWPWCSFRAMYYTVMDAAISNLSKQDILYNNFEMILRW